MRRTPFLVSLAALSSLLPLYACSDTEENAIKVVTDDGGIPLEASVELDAAPSLPSLTFTQLSIADTADDVPCSGTAGTAAIGRVAFAQTHLMTPDWPFFYLVGDRPALLFADITGSGASPEVSVEAKSGGTSLGKKCLKGPATLPASLDVNAPDRATSFSMTLPSAWMKAGVELVVRAGSATRTFTPAELKIGAAPIGTFLTANFLFFGDTEGHPRGEFPREFLSKTALAHLNVAHFPVELSFQKFVVSPDRLYGTDAAGNPAVSPVQWATRTPSCTTEEKAAKTCTGYGAFAFIGAVRNLMGEIQKANGLGAMAAAYGDISKKGGADGAGLGGGRLGAGGNYGLVFNHEMGHGFGFPHWQDITPPRASDPKNTYPYIGDYLNDKSEPNGGGFGRTWAYDALDGTLISPLCPKNGKEMHDPMQRHGDCASAANLKAGRVFDFYSDFTAFRFYRYFTGGPAITGTVPYHGGNAPFGAPTVGAVVEWPDTTALSFRRWNATTSAYESPAPKGLDLPIELNRPVYLLYGAFHLPSDTLSTIYMPVLYRGNMIRQFDPTTATDFETIKKDQLAYFGRDLTLRVEYRDGTVRHVLLDVNARGAKANDPTSDDSLRPFAANVPADKPLKKVTLLYRPLSTRAANDPFAGNIVGNDAVTPANLFAGAREAAVYEAP